MSETDRGAVRANGAFDNFLAEMKARFEREGRSEQYKEAFYDNLRNRASDYAQFGD